MNTTSNVKRLIRTCPTAATTYPPVWLKAVLDAARLSPSHENCQPWRFEWNGTDLVVRENEERARHELNRRKHTSLLNLGCLLESISMAARSQGKAAYFTWDAKSISECLSVKVSFVQDNEVDPKANELLAQRKTDRRLYQGGEMAARLRMELLLSAPPSGSVVLHLSKGVSSKVTDYIMDVETRVWMTKKSRLDLLKWFRLKPGEDVKYADGLGWKTMGIQKWETFFIRHFHRPVLGTLLLKWGGLAGIRRLIKNQISSSSNLGLITVRTHHPNELINAGRLLLRTWCRLNQAGFGVHPMAEGALGIYDLDTRALSPAEVEQQGALFDKGRKLFRPFFQLSSDEIPVVFFRTGKNSPLPVENQSLRKPIDIKMK